MNDDLKILFGPYREAVIAIKGKRIAFGNAAANALVPDLEKKKPQDVFPAELLDYEASSFVGAAKIGVRLYTVAVTEFSGMRIFTIFPMETNSEEAALLLSAINTKMREYVNVVKMSSGLLMPHVEEYGSEKLNRLVSMISHNCYRMERAIRSVDEFGNPRKNAEEPAFDLAELYADLVDSTEHMVREHGIRFTFTANDADHYTSGDSGKLETLLMHLLSNSIKSTPDGGHIEVKLTKTEDRTVLTVHDDGCGIPEDKMFSVWNRYSAPADGAGAPSDGIGLGLTLVQQTARSYGGSAILESTPGKGTTVAVIMHLPKVRNDMLREPCPRRRNSMNAILRELSDVIEYEKYNGKYMD